MPHGAQVWFAPHPSPVLHMSFAQHGSPIAPHGQTPFVHAPPPGHMVTQVPPCSLQQPFEQALPAQQI
jgi:hypothetical protein